jgi:hypothetical protein
VIAALLDEETLSAEALLLGRYLLGRGPQEETVARYVTANRRLFAEPFEPRDVAVLNYCRRHPRALPLLDAGAGLVAGQSLLRKKSLVMAAILEMTTKRRARLLRFSVSCFVACRPALGCCRCLEWPPEDGRGGPFRVSAISFK